MLPHARILVVFVLVMVRHKMSTMIDHDCCLCAFSGDCICPCTKQIDGNVCMGTLACDNNLFALSWDCHGVASFQLWGVGGGGGKGSMDKTIVL